MPITVEWDNEEKTILHYKTTGIWNWEEFYTVYQEAVKMRLTVPHMVDILSDLRGSSFAMPKNVLSHIGSIADRKQNVDNLGIAVFVTDSRMIKGLYTILSRLRGSVKDNYFVVPTLEEAYAIIEKTKQARLENDSSTPA